MGCGRAGDDVLWQPLVLRLWNEGQVAPDVLAANADQIGIDGPESANESSKAEIRRWGEARVAEPNDVVAAIRIEVPQAGEAKFIDVVRLVAIGEADSQRRAIARYEPVV